MKRKLVCLPIEMYKREFDAKVFLAVKALERGYQAVVGQHKDPVLLKTPKGFYLYKDHGVGSLRLIDHWHQRDCIIAALDEEGLIPRSEDVYKRARVTRETIDKLDVVFAWGEDQKELLHRCDVGKEVIVSGNPRFDLLHYMRESTAGKGKETQKKKNILLNSRFGSINSMLGENHIDILKECGEIKTDDDMTEFLDFMKNDKLIFDEFIRLIHLLGHHSEYNVKIRPHPEEKVEPYVEAAKGYPNVTVDHRSRLIDDLLECDILVHDGCTTAIEAKALGKTVLGLRPASVDYDYGELANKFSLNLESAEEVLEFIARSQDQNADLEIDMNFATRRVANFLTGDSHKVILDKADDFDLPEIDLVDYNSCRSVKRLVHNTALSFYRNFPIKSVFDSDIRFLDKFSDLHNTYETIDKKFPDLSEAGIRKSLAHACELAGNTDLLDKIDLEILSKKSFRISLA